MTGAKFGLSQSSGRTETSTCTGMGFLTGGGGQGRAVEHGMLNGGRQIVGAAVGSGTLTLTVLATGFAGPDTSF